MDLFRPCRSGAALVMSWMPSFPSLNKPFCLSRFGSSHAFVTSHQINVRSLGSQSLSHTRHRFPLLSLSNSQRSHHGGVVANVLPPLQPGLSLLASNSATQFLRLCCCREEAERRGGLEGNVNAASLFFYTSNPS